MSTFELGTFLASKFLKFCITICVAFTNVSFIIVGSEAMKRYLFENSFDTSAVKSLIATKIWLNGKRLRSVTFFFIVALWLSCAFFLEGVYSGAPPNRLQCGPSHSLSKYETKSASMIRHLSQNSLDIILKVIGFGANWILRISSSMNFLLHMDVNGRSQRFRITWAKHIISNFALSYDS